MAIDPRRLLEALAGEKVDFVIVGGVAFVLHGSTRVTRDTDAGDLDLLGEITGVGGFGEIARGAASMEVYGLPVRVMGLDDVERAKRAAGRLKDLADLAELLEIRRRRGE
jgi:hypothetical protein